jgi:hypothetical protein
MMEANLTNCFGGFGNNWIAYDQDGNYAVTDLQLTLGQGYYLALSNVIQTLALNGDPVTGDPDGGHLASLGLSSGWNLVSNPLVNVIDRDLLTVESEGVVKSWQDAATAGWVQTNINTWYIDSHEHVNRLTPFGGYWIHTSRDLEVHVTPHLETPDSRSDVADEGWSLTLNARDAQGNAGGDFVKILLSENANNNFVYGEDEFDHPNPIRSDFIDLHIDRYDWVGDSDSHGIMVESPYFAQEVRSYASGDDVQIWNISADAYNIPGDIKLSWNMINDIDSDVHLVIKGEAYNLKELTSIDVPSSSADEMMVVVGDVSSIFAPEHFALSNAYPNPFNPTTRLNLDLNNDGHVSVMVYNLVGQIVTELVNGHMSAGYHTIEWSAYDNPSGMYIVKVVTGNDVAVQKVMLMK